VLLLRSHTLPLVGDSTPPAMPPAQAVDWAKVVYEGEDAVRRQAVEGRPVTAAWLQANWVVPAVAKRDGKVPV
jgi:hypothetical protein